MGHRVAAATALFAVVLGCGGDDDVPLDGGGSDSGGALDAGPDGGGVTPPDIPWLDRGLPPVMFTPCPEGWREASDGSGVVTCAPYPEAGPNDCPRGQAHFPGEAGCRSIGDACPTGDYATTIPKDGPIIYVDPSASSGGDGSRASPFSSLAEARLSALSAGTTVALAKGTYRGDLSLASGTSVVGACAAETRVVGARGSEDPVLTITTSGEPAVVRNLAISDPSVPGVWISEGRALTLEGVLIEGAVYAGLLISDAGSVVTARDLVIRGTRPQGSEYGFGLLADAGARFEGSRVVVEGSRDAAVLLFDPGTSITLEDSVIRDTDGTPDGEAGEGVYLDGGGRFEARRTLISGNRLFGVFAQGAGGEVELTDVIVRGTRSRESDGARGTGIHVQDGAYLEATRTLVSRNHSVGVVAFGTDASAVLTDVVVSETVPQESDGLGGVGIALEGGAQLEATRIIVSHNHLAGLVAQNPGSAANFTDAAFVGTLSQGGVTGDGIVVISGSSVSATRLLVADNHEAGIIAQRSGTSVTLTDVVVRETRPREGDDKFGVGIVAAFEAQMSMSKVRIERVYEVGLTVLGGAIVEARDLTVVQVDLSLCGCDDVMGYAVGVVAAELRLTGFALRDAATCGLFVGDFTAADPGMVDPYEPVLDVERGVVEGSRIGACVQVDGFDVARLTSEVVYRDNETNLQATSLPVPQPPGTLER